MAGLYDHMLTVADGDKDTAFPVPLAEWEPWEGGGSGHLPSGNYAFKVVEAKVVSTSERAQRQGKNLRLTLTSTAPKGSEGVTVNCWHQFPGGDPAGDQYRRDLDRFQSLIASIRSATPGGLEKATTKGAAPVTVNARALEGRTVFAAVQDLAESRSARPFPLKVWDEPGDNLDARGKEMFLRWVESEARARGTGLLITHDEAIASQADPDAVWTVILERDGARVELG